MNAVLHTQKQPDVFNEFYLVAAEHSEAALGIAVMILTFHHTIEGEEFFYDS